MAFEAFAQLSNARGAGFSGPLPIQVSEVLAWCQLQGITDPDRRDTIRRFVAALDAEWMDHHGKAGT